MESYPIPWIEVLNNLNFKDFTYIISTFPDFRKILLNYFSIPVHYQLLERNIILECIDELEQNININFFDELLSFFEQNGYVEDGYTPEVKKEVNTYLDDLIELFKQNKDGTFTQKYIDSQIELLKNLKLENKIPYDLMDRFKHANVYKFYDHQERTRSFRDRIQDIRLDKINLFKVNFLFGQYGYQNTLKYLLEVNEWLEQNMNISDIQNFKTCMSFKLGKLDFIISSYKEKNK